MKKSILIVLSIALLFTFNLSGCGSEKKSNNIVEAPDKISTLDEAKIEQDPYAVEESDNVNGMRYSITLKEFSNKYNEMLKEAGSLDMINSNGWIKKGDPEKETNGVDIQYYYYNADKISITATVEVKTGKIMNIGIGTTMSTFLSVEKNKSYSDVVLMKCGIMAAAVGGFPIEKVNVLQDVFYRTTFENVDTIWYEGNVFCLSTSRDKGDSERSTMLFRVFPVSEDVKKQWKMVDYKSYMATLPAEN